MALSQRDNCLSILGFKLFAAQTIRYMVAAIAFVPCIDAALLISLDGMDSTLMETDSIILTAKA